MMYFQGSNERLMTGDRDGSGLKPLQPTCAASSQPVTANAYINYRGTDNNL